MAQVVQKIGHRGCRGWMPENTIPAFKKAIDFNVNSLEMDVVISKDLKVVVSHEAYFNHEFSLKPDGSEVDEHDEKSYNLYRMNYAQIKEFDVGLKPHPRFPHQKKMKLPKPLLEEVIDSCEPYALLVLKKPIHYTIEIKCSPATDLIYHPLPSVMIDLLMEVIIKKNIQTRVTLQSFDVRPLQYLHKHFPDIKIAYLIEGPELKSMDQQMNELGFIPSVYSPDHELVNDSMQQQCKKMGMELVPWTVNDLNRIRALIEMGVDGIITDYPNLFRDLSDK